MATSPVNCEMILDEKLGCTDMTSIDDLDAELDDEVEKELREFEQLQNGLLGAVSQESNVEDGATKEGSITENEILEKSNGSDSDMEIDEDLQREIADAKKISPRSSAFDAQKIDHASKNPVLDRTDHSNAQVLPETLIEDNLRGDDLLEKSRIPADGEEACLDMERVRLYRERASDPLNPGSFDFTKPWNQTSKTKPQQLRANTNTKNWAAGQCSSILQTMKQNSKEKEERGEEDLLSKQKSRSRGTIICSKPQQYKLGAAHDGLNGSTIQNNNQPSENCMPPLKRIKPSPPKMQHLGNKLQWLAQAPVSKTSFLDRIIQIPVKTTARSESETSKPCPGTSQKENSILQATPLVPKEGFAEPVLKMPVQPKSATNAAKAVSVDTMLNMAVQPKSSPNQNLSFMDPVFDNPKPSCPTSQPQTSEVDPKQSVPLVLPSNPHDDPTPVERPVSIELLNNSSSLVNVAADPENQHVEASSSHKQPGTQQSPKIIIDITRDPPVEYCVIEQILHIRFKYSSLLDDEKSELMKNDRPSIWCPELHPYVAHYDKQTWLAACNELARFYCWPCLLFSGKAIWSMSCDGRKEASVFSEINKHMQSPGHRDCLNRRDAWTTKKKVSIIKTLMDNVITRSEKHQEKVIMKGRPCPILKGRTERKSSADKKAAFEDFYSRVSWICGCTSTEQFYCWPCVIFCKTGASAEQFTYAGTIESSESAVLQHETDPKHMDACLKLGKCEFGLKDKIAAKTEDMQNTRNFLSCLSEVLCAEKKKINNAEFSAGDYVESLEMMSEYDKNLKIFLEKLKNSTDAIAKTVALYTPATLNSIEYFIKCGILDEIKNSKFISLIMDHSSGLSHKAILSVIARYVDENGNVHERFIKFLNVGYNTPFSTLSEEFFRTIAELQCRSSLVGFTYDGYLLVPEKIPGFNAKVQKLCPNARFFHYNEHSFIRVLKQTICHMPSFRAVLQVVEKLTNFFKRLPVAKKGLLDIIKTNGKSEGTIDFSRSTHFIRAVFLHHNSFIKIMENISGNAINWRRKTVVQAKIFLDFLNEAKNRFFITVMAHIFNSVEGLSVALDADDGNDVKSIARQTVAKICELGRNFNNIVDLACSHLKGSILWDQARKELSIFRGLFSNVVRLVTQLIKNRIIDLELGYFKISKSSSPLSTSIKLQCHGVFLQNLALPLNFSSTKLMREMQFFHDASIFTGLDISEIISLMNNYKMIRVLPEMFKFLQLALTIPKKLYEDSTIPAVHRISAYVEAKKDLNSTEALLWMEKEFLTNLQTKENFYGKVAEHVLLTKTNGFAQSIIEQ